MSTKTERIELRLDADLIERVDEWRSKQGDMPSRSEALRRLINSGLAEDSPEGFRLNNVEKLMTWMLSEIRKDQLKSQKGGGSEYDLKEVDLLQEAILGGHFWALPWEMSGVLHDHADDPRNVRMVVDTLDMWSFIEEAYESFDEAEKKHIEKEAKYRGKNPKFIGFDGNNEIEHMSIARFLVEKMERFERFKGREFNSHNPKVMQYRRMLADFEGMRNDLIGRKLSPDQVIKLLNVASED